MLTVNITMLERLAMFAKGEHGTEQSRTGARYEIATQALATSEHHEVVGFARDRLGVPLPDPAWIDRRNEPRPEGFERGLPSGTRTWADMEAVGLHQTASGLLHAGHRRILAIPAHAIVHQDGRCTLLHYATSYIHHGHGMNRWTFGIEIDCRVDGVEGEPKTFWRSPNEINGYADKKGRWHPPRSREQLRRPLTEAQVETTLRLIAWVDALRRHHHGRGLESVYAHRQAHKDKRSDPGSAIWQRVALPAIGELGLESRPLKLFGGRQLPDVWTGENNGVRY